MATMPAMPDQLASEQAAVARQKAAEKTEKAEKIEKPDAIVPTAPGPSKGPSLRCRRFTPPEAEIDKGLCLARTWSDGRGGQCQHYQGAPGHFCKLHMAGGQGQEQWRVYGHVMGPIPEDKLLEFEKHADLRSSVRVDLGVWKKRRLISRNDALDMEPRALSTFLRACGYSGEKWRSHRENLLTGRLSQEHAVEELMQEQANDLWNEVVRMQRDEGEARARLLL